MGGLALWPAGVCQNVCPVVISVPPGVLAIWTNDIQLSSIHNNIWAVGHFLKASSSISSGLPPQEAPVMIAEKRKLFFSFLWVWYGPACRPWECCSSMQYRLRYNSLMKCPMALSSKGSWRNTTSITQYPAFSSTGKLNASLGHTIRHCSLFLLSTPAFFCGFSLDRTIAHGTDLLVGCQHRCTNPAEAKALPHEGASALVMLLYTSNLHVNNAAHS